MSRSLPGVHTELSAAVRRVSEHYERVPEFRRPDINGERWVALEAELDLACSEGDRDRAHAAVRRWESHAARVLGALA